MTPTKAIITIVIIWIITITAWLFEMIQAHDYNVHCIHHAEVIIQNDYPYDMCRDKKVKTDHITIFYKNTRDINFEIDHYLKQWYTVQINSSGNQSITEIQHLHFIKIIDEN